MNCEFFFLKATETTRQDVQPKKVETQVLDENKENESTDENKAKNNVREKLRWKEWALI